MAADGARVGKVEAVMIDLEQGRISYLRIASAGDTSRKIIVPWRAVRIQTQPPVVHLSISAEKFIQAPRGNKLLIIANKDGPYTIISVWLLIGRINPTQIRHAPRATCESFDEILSAFALTGRAAMLNFFSQN